METYAIDAAVIGAGAAGLAIGRALAQAGHETLVLETGPRIGEGVSSRSSEVIHAGIYYPEGSLKARACVSGARALYGYLAARGVGHRRCGKLIVAMDAGEEAALSALFARGRANGAEGLELLSGAVARTLEPALAPGVRAALHSPATGIFDSHGFLVALLGDLEAAGGRLALNTPVLRGEAGADGILLHTGGAAPARLRARIAVNAAGLAAEAVSRAIAGLAPETIPRTCFAKGSYFSAPGRCPFARLVYPAPEPGGLGVHLTFDLSGAMRFGPDVEWTGDPADLAVDPARAPRFEAAVRRYFPGLKGPLSPAYAGMRPKLSGPGEAAADFRLDGPAEHGVPGLLCLYGIESPGLTAALALADLALAALAE